MHRLAPTRLAAFVAICAAAFPAGAADSTPAAYLATSQGAFEDVVAALEDAVVNRGLVIDYTGKIGDMLARTAGAVGAPSPYSNAIYMQFCSAPLTNAAVQVDPANISVCPYVLFAYELAAKPGEVTAGYRRPTGSGEWHAQIEALLKGIVDEAVE